MSEPVGTGDQPRCSIVVRCFNEAEHIGRLLEDIGRQTLKDVEIVVVDSGSTDGTLDIVRRYPVKLLSIRPSEFTFGRALNIGCRAATGEFIVAASAHVYPVSDDWLERLLEPFDDERIGLAYGKQRGADSSHYSELRLFESWFPDASNSDQDHPFCNNANAAIRRKLWLDQPYDESLTGLEDIDWAKKAMARGYGVAYAADATIIHVHDETSAQITNRYRREAIALKHIYPSERFSFWNFLHLFARNARADLRHARNEGAFFRRFWDVMNFRFRQFWGTYQGYHQSSAPNAEMRRRFYYPGARANDSSANGQENSNSESRVSIEKRTAAPISKES